MRRLYSILIMCCLFFGSWAQTQQGFVRTISRPNRQAKPISDVTITVNVAGNSILTNQNGFFSFPCNKASYRIMRVQKNGYQLVDKGVIGRHNPYSPSIRQEIVMVSESDLQADKKRIEDKAYARAQADYEKRLSDIKKKLEEEIITEQQASQAEAELGDDYQNYIEMIEDMAERYATTDYEGISDINRQILQYIENAEMEKADSLINSKGNIEQRIQELKEQQIINEQTRTFLEKSENDASIKMNDLAEDCYNKYTIYESRFQNDSAAYFLEQRAALDSTNVEWQNDAGQFLAERLAYYPQALIYLQHALNQSVIQYGEHSSWAARAYNNIGCIYDYQGFYEETLKNYLKALEIYKDIPDDDETDLSLCYNNIGYVYSKLGNYDEALSFHRNALNIRISDYGENSIQVAQSYGNIGIVYYHQKDYNNALVYFLKAVNIRKTVNGEQNQEVAIDYNNIGMVYSKQGNYEKALEYLQLSFGIRQKVLGEKHPETAESYNNIGSIYDDMGNLEKAQEYYLKTSEILEEIVGKHHEWTGIAYSNIGSIYERQENYDKALEYYEIAKDIFLNVLGEQHAHTKQTISKIELIKTKL